MRVLVTGASGFVGQAVVEMLLDAGYDITATSRSNLHTAAYPHFNLEIDSHTDWSEALKGVSHVVHSAARVHILHETSQVPICAFREINTFGTLNLARQAIEQGVKRFIFISTIGVNGNKTHTRPFSENDQPYPHGPYAISKYEAERGLISLVEESDMELVIIRPPLIYGAGVKGNFATLQKLVNLRIPLPLGAIQNQRSFIGLSNFCEFVWLCLHDSRAANQTFVIADDERHSTTEILRYIAEAESIKVLLIPLPEKYLRLIGKCLGKRAEVNKILDSLVIDNRKAHERLGWSPKVSMTKELKKAAISKKINS